MSSRARLLIALPLLAVAAIAIAVRRGASEETWGTVEQRELVIEAEVTGELRALESSDLGPPPSHLIWNYKLSYVAPEGDAVKQGQPVLRFDVSELEPKLLQALAELDRAGTALEKAQTDLDVAVSQAELALAEARGQERRASLESTIPAEVIENQKLKLAQINRDLARREIRFREDQAQRTRDRADIELTGLQRQHQRAAAKVREMREQIDSMTVLAPRDGTVVLKTNWRGEKKKVGDSVWRQEVILQIPDLTQMEVAAEISETDAGHVEVGQAVQFRLDAHPEVTYSATVDKVQRAVQERSWRDRRKVVRLSLSLEQTDPERMRPGMRIKGAIEIERTANTLMVPFASLAPRVDGAQVWVKTASHQGWITPKLGRRNGDWVEVLGGLAEGDRVQLISQEGSGLGS